MGKNEDLRPHCICYVLNRCSISPSRIIRRRKTKKSKGCKAPTHKGGKFICKGFKAQSCKSKKCKVVVKADKKGNVKSATKTCGKKKTNILKSLQKNWKC